MLWILDSCYLSLNLSSSSVFLSLQSLNVCLQMFPYTLEFHIPPKTTEMLLTRIE